jgi:hypothetical protein
MTETTFTRIFRECAIDVVLVEHRLFAAVKRIAGDAGIAITKSSPEDCPNLLIKVQHGRNVRLDLCIVHQTDEELAPARKFIAGLAEHLEPQSIYEELKVVK